MATAPSFLLPPLSYCLPPYSNFSRLSASSSTSPSPPAFSLQLQVTFGWWPLTRGGDAFNIYGMLTLCQSLRFFLSIFRPSFQLLVSPVSSCPQGWRQVLLSVEWGKKKRNEEKNLPGGPNDGLSSFGPFSIIVCIFPSFPSWSWVVVLL